MDTLLDELCLQILAFLPTFEDRWQASLVNWQWRRAYRVLLKPHNDTLASEHLHFLSKSYLTACGPVFTLSTNTDYAAMTIHFWLRGEQIMPSFGLGGHTDIDVYWSGGLGFDLDYDCLKDRWRIDHYNRHTFFPLKKGGDIFDVVLQAKAALCRREKKLWQHVQYNPALARRLWSFPAFVHARKEVEAVRLAAEKARLERPPQ